MDWKNFFFSFIKRVLLKKFGIILIKKYVINFDTVEGVHQSAGVYIYVSKHLL